MNIIDKSRITWAIAQLTNLENGGNIRYEGNSVFQGLKAELLDIEANAPAYVEAPPQVLQVMTADQVDQVAARLANRTGELVGTLAKTHVEVVGQMGVAVMDHMTQAVGAITADVERSDAMLTSAIVQTGQDVIQALTPAA